jgi:hypothetical protein
VKSLVPAETVHPGDEEMPRENTQTATAPATSTPTSGTMTHPSRTLRTATSGSMW